MRPSVRFFLLALCLFTMADARCAEKPWRLVWSDEFNDRGRPNRKKWNYEEGFVRNEELQFYTKDRARNARVEDGNLVIEADKEDFNETARYTSASLTTQGKADWKHGRFEIRAKLPAGRGMWPAIWLLGSKINRVGWPECGEIDIMEYVGFLPDTIHGTVHTSAYNHTLKTQRGKTLEVAAPHASFHIYAIEWSKDRIDFFVDDQKYFTFSNEGTGRAVWPFDGKHFLILNVAIGGNWGGQKGVDDSIFPQRMLVDYVRVYQRR